MGHSYWQKQNSVQPLFPDLLWSRPENKKQAGKLLIIGGNQFGFAAPAEAYNEAMKAGIGTARVLLPSALKKIIGPMIETAEFAPSTPSGSFSQQALSDWLEQGAWADGVLIAGDLGRNSETAIVCESFLSKYDGQVTLTKDAVDYCLSIAKVTLSRPETTLVLSTAQLQKLAVAAKFKLAITYDMDFLHLIEALHEFTLLHSIYIVVRHLDKVFVAVNGQVSTTKLVIEQPVWRVKTASAATVWWLQNRDKPFEALSTALVA